MYNIEFLSSCTEDDISIILSVLFCCYITDCLFLNWLHWYSKLNYTHLRYESSFRIFIKEMLKDTTGYTMFVTILNAITPLLDSLVV